MFVPDLGGLTTLKSRNVKRSVQLEDLVKIKGMSECLGKGVSGTVWKVRDKSLDETLALKEMAMDTTDEAKNQMLVDEMQIMLALDHPSIVACHGVFYELGMFKIVMEFCDAGSLLDVMRLGDHKIPADALASMMHQVLKAMAYLHTDKRVIHRDVKPGNILLNRQGQCKLADFGVCSKPREARDSMCATWVGTVTYMSPERIKGDSYSFNADVWALGVIVVEATLGRYPYLAEVVDGIDKKKFEFWDLLYSLDDAAAPCATKKLPADTDKNLVSFAQYVLDKDHETRASSTEALNHPFIANVSTNPEQMRQRISAWVNNTLQGPRGMDAKKISDALGGLNLGKPPLAPATAGVDVRESVRVETEASKRGDKVGVMPSPRDFPTPRENGRPPSTTATPRKHPGGNDDEISSKNKAQVVVPTSSRNTSRTVAESSTKGVNGGTGLNGQADSNGNGSSKSINGFSPARNSPRTGKDGAPYGWMMEKGAPLVSISAGGVV